MASYFWTPCITSQLSEFSAAEHKEYDAECVQFLLLCVALLAS